MIAKVFAESKSEGAARLVLLALADVAADTGEITAYKRSYSILAGKANCAEGTVRRSIAKLVELGELVVLEQGGGRRSTSYQITLEGAPDDHAPDEHPARASGASRVDEVSTQGAPDEHPVSPSSSIDGPSSSTPLELQLAEPPPRWTFDAFWAAYPRHVAKAAAERAWKQALNHAPGSTIVEGAARYASEVADRTPDKIAHPATWLNGRRWEDPPGANASKRTGPGSGSGPGAPIVHDRNRTAGRVTL